MANFWMVRSDENIRDRVEKEGFIGIGFGGEAMGDLTGLSRDKVRQLVADHRGADATANQIGSTTGQLYRFANDIEVGDRVITMIEGRQYLVGTITSDYRYDMSPPGQPYRRSVEWHSRHVGREEMSPALKNTLGGLMTVFNVTRHEEEILRLLEKRTASTREETGHEFESTGFNDTEALTESEYAEDIEAKARERIEDLILDPRRFGGHDFEGFVAALLKAMGFKIVREPQPGADGGIDIIAAPDVFGFEQPRIIVQVKHRQSQASAGDVQQLKGTLQLGEKGLFVSTGGFSRDAERLAAQNLTLLDGRKIVDYFVEHYESMPSEYKAKVPLKRVYIPVPPDED